MTIQQRVDQTLWQVAFVVCGAGFGFASWLFYGAAHDLFQGLMLLSWSGAGLSLAAQVAAAHTPTCDTCGDACRDEDNGLCGECLRRMRAHREVA